MYSETWELGTPKGLSKAVLISEVVLFLGSISTEWIQLGTEVSVLNSQGVPICQVLLKTGFTVLICPDDIPIYPDELLHRPDDIPIRPDNILLRPDEILIRPDDIIIRPGYIYLLIR